MEQLNLELFPTIKKESLKDRLAKIGKRNEPEEIKNWELVSRDEAQARRGFNNHNGNIQEKALISNLSSKQDEQNLSNLDSNSTDKTLSRECNSTDKALSALHNGSMN